MPHAITVKEIGDKDFSVTPVLEVCPFCGEYGMTRSWIAGTEVEYFCSHCSQAFYSHEIDFEVVPTTPTCPKCGEYYLMGGHDFYSCPSCDYFEHLPKQEEGLDSFSTQAQCEELAGWSF